MLYLNVYVCTDSVKKKKKHYCTELAARRKPQTHKRDDDVCVIKILVVPCYGETRQGQSNQSRSNLARTGQLRKQILSMTVLKFTPLVALQIRWCNV